MKNRELIKEKSHEIKLLFGKTLAASNSKEGKRERIKFYIKEIKTFFLIALFLNIFRFVFIDQDLATVRKVLEAVTITIITTFLFTLVSIAYYEIRIWYHNR